MTISTSPKWAPELIEMLDQQRRIYEQLRDLAAQQSQFVAEGQAEPLLRVLGQRQQLIDELVRINGRLEPFKSNWPALWNELDEPTQRSVQGLIDQVQQLLDVIVEQDEKDRTALLAHRERCQSQMQQVSAGSAVHRAYGQANHGGRGPRYTDQQG